VLHNWSSLHRWEVHTVDVVATELLPACRALLLSLNGSLDALLAENMAAAGG
jgi:hypothetical protein